MSTKKKTKKNNVKAVSTEQKKSAQRAEKAKADPAVKPADKSGRKACAKKWVRPTLWVVIAVLAVILVLAVLLWIGLAHTVGQEEPTVPATVPTQPTTVPTEPTQVEVPWEEIVVEQAESIRINLGHGLEITDVGNYTGVYMEDGTNEVVSDLLMIIVKNTGEQDIQYAEITMEAGQNDAFFSLSTLPAGESVVLLEKNRMTWSEDTEYNNATAENVAIFSAPLSLCADQLKLQILDGAINVTNISSQDITGDIVIYYKNAAADLYYGGITYRVRIEGGMAADELRQIMASHFSSSGSKIMFVTVG